MQDGLMSKVQIFLITPRLVDAESFAPQLEAALRAASVACVLVRLATRDDNSAKKLIKALAPLVQEKGAALLVEQDSQLAARTDADGVQVSGAGQNLRDAEDSLKPKHIVGVSGLKSKDDAMTAGELDVDYLMFGEPSADGFVQNIAKIIERVEWWAQVFNVPCVAYAPRLADVAPLVKAGADFIATGDWLWAEADTTSSLLREVADVIRTTPSPVL